MKTPEVLYEKRRKRYDELYLKQNRLANLISNVRLLVFVIGLIVAGVLYFFRLHFLSAAAVIITAAAFINVVLRHTKILNNKRHFEFMRRINEDALKRISGEWKDFEDTGEEFLDRDHGFSYDLDMFGKGSLFQMINITQTYEGRKIIKKAITVPTMDSKEISARQEAICELSQKLSWRQSFAAEGMAISKDASDPSFLYQWVANTNDFYQKSWVRYLCRVAPLITILLLTVSVITKAIPIYIPGILLAAQGIAIKVNSKSRGRVLEEVQRYKDSIRVYVRLLKKIEGVQFNSTYLKSLRSRLTNKEGVTASKQVNRLSKLVDSISNRYNAFYIIFDILTLWDYQCIISLDDWKRKSGTCLKEWLESIGEFESLSSLAILSFDNRDWVMPEITEEDLVYRAKGMGHPLLGKKGIRNDLGFDKDAKVLLITGSNMSGKSTLLRTAGINLVLAYAGAAVCAKSFCCSLMEIHTCMRISDNLEKSISSFYAELLRIKTIVQAARENRRIFFLLDEIFKGTNSIDRHLGAKVLVKKLADCMSLGLVSTHDLELGELENENHRVRNYHFREYYKDNEIKFDYKLQKGISKTRNAVYLMKLAGIEFDDGK